MSESMDVQRPDLAVARRRRRVVNVVAGAAIVVLAGALVRRLAERPPSVARASIIIGRVERADLIRDVSSSGTLVPKKALLLAAEAPGRVLEISLAPGANVAPETVVLRLTNPELEQAALEAESRLRIAEADLLNENMQLDMQASTLRAEMVTLEAELRQARLHNEATERLAREGLAASIDVKIGETRLTDIAERISLLKDRDIAFRRGAAAKRSAREAEVSARRSVAQLRSRQVTGLVVRARMKGVLQSVSVEPGQEIATGLPLARVADPSQLIARLRVPAAQAREVVPDLPVALGIAGAARLGRVTRVDPGVKDGVVVVDVTPIADLPPGARPDLPVEGTIEIAKVSNVLQVARPVQEQEGLTASIFLVETGGYARRVTVRFGRASSKAIEIRAGLNLDDEVIISDMSGWAKWPRVRLH